MAACLQFMTSAAMLLSPFILSVSPISQSPGEKEKVYYIFGVGIIFFLQYFTCARHYNIIIVYFLNSIILHSVRICGAVNHHSQLRGVGSGGTSAQGRQDCTC